jgi:hypothetical protein
MRWTRQRQARRRSRAFFFQDKFDPHLASAPPKCLATSISVIACTCDEAIVFLRAARSFARACHRAIDRPPVIASWLVVDEHFCSLSERWPG